ncbi:MAG: ABC transporter ATP-binding protein [Nitrospinae bacterium]|nr:ABC transporter ATP-binding protein [Nitrospinota bacterium]
MSCKGGNIRVKNLSKKYKLFPSKVKKIVELFSLGRIVTHDPHWVLNNINVEIESGETIGIIGQNGAGKSTLLKILTGTTQATSGTVEINGKVAALLELGMGFHENFSGRQNARMACQLTGLNMKEIDGLLPEIEEFSELKDYMEQPLRTYSDGMKMRLAFSVATATRPDILIVDEALSVGDTYFQHKSIERIRSFQKEGVTTFFVSHDPAAVKTLCNRAILLHNGGVEKDGTPDDVLDYYNALIASREEENIQQSKNQVGKTITRSGNQEANITSVTLTNQKGNSIDTFRVGEKAIVRCQVKFNKAIEEPTVGILIRDRLGNDVFGTSTYHLSQEKISPQAGEIIEVIFEIDFNLGSGSYSITLAVHAADSHIKSNYDWLDKALIFTIVPNNSYNFIGVASLPISSSIKTFSAPMK